MSGSAVNVIQAGSIGSISYVMPAPLPVVPAQTPLPSKTFTNRERVLAQLRDLAGEAGRPAPAVVAVRGMRGVGKTALLSKAAATIGNQFPDGVLHVVFGPAENSPSEAAARLLTGLGVPPQHIPTAFEQRLTMYRSMTATLSLLVVFDDVADAAQVTALLPNSPASMVLAAGNRVLEDLIADGAVDVELRRLSTTDGVRLLATICGAERVDADPTSAAELVEIYDGLPLAIRVTAGRLAVRPKWTVRRVLAELRDAAAGVSEVEARLFATVDVVYGELPEPLRRLYRVLGLVVGVRFGAEVLAAMCERPVGAVRADLDRLYQVGLVEEDQADSYRLHRLVRRHALHQSGLADADAERRALRRRAVDWWLFGAMTADVAIDPGRLRVPDPEVLRVEDGHGVSPVAGLDWLDREHANLLEVLAVAADEGRHAEVCRLFEALFALYKVRKPLSAWVRAGRIAVESAVHTGRADTEARCRCLLAKAYQELERYEQAHAELARARELVEDGPERFTASTYDFTGNVHLSQGEFETALGWFRRALDINRRLGQVRGTALQSMLVGRALGKLGRYDEALEMVGTARDLVAGGTAESLLPKILASTGAVLAAAGRFDEAERTLLDAVERADAQGNTADAADALITLAEQADRRGAAGEARVMRERAVRLLERMGSPRAARVIVGLAEE